MIINKLKKDMIAAWKSGNIERKTVLSNMIDAIQKAAIGPKGRVEITEDKEAEILMKYQKTVQEQYDTCPDGEKYSELKAKYAYELKIVKEYAPQTISNEDVIKQLITKIQEENSNLIFEMANRAQIMKLVMPTLKQKHCDMRISQNILNSMLH